MITFSKTNVEIYFDDSLLSRSACLRFFVLRQTDGQIEPCCFLFFFEGGGLKRKSERQMSRKKLGEKREEREAGEEKGICWVSDNLRIRLWRRNQAAASQPLPTWAWHGTVISMEIMTPHPRCLWPFCCRVNLESRVNLKTSNRYRDLWFLCAFARLNEKHLWSSLDLRGSSLTFLLSFSVF